MPLTKVKSGGVSDSITLTSPDINAPDIDGGTIDNAVIGGSTAAAGSFTTITATGGSSSNWNTAYGWGDHSTQSYATQTYVGTEVSNLVDSSPAALDTLNELAAALGDDPNFATTVTNSIALKAPLASPSFTGNVLVGRTSSLSSQSGSVSANTVVSAHGGLQSHATSAGILEHYNDATLLRSYGANAGSGELVFKVGGGGGSTDSEAMRIDSSGNVGIGTSSPNGNGILTLNTPADNSAQIVFAENDTAKWLIGHRHDGDYFRFYDLANSAERMRIDASGNLFVGKASLNIGLTGQELRAGGSSYFTSSSDTTLGLNRLSSDGTVLEIRKDNAIVGSLGSNASGGTPVLDISANSSSGIMRMLTSGTERMRIDSSGLLKIGTSSTVSPYSLSKFAIDTGTYSFMDLLSTGSSGINFGDAGGAQRGIIEYNHGSDYLRFGTAGSERMRITSAGSLYVGAGFSTWQSNSFGVEGLSSGAYTVTSHISGAPSGQPYSYFFYNNGVIGSITQNGTTGVAYNTSSDYRLKENVVPMTGSIDRVKALKPSRFNFIADADTTVDGFLAHEAQAVVPECVTGTKDAMKDEEYEVTAAIEEVRDEDGNITTEAVEAVMGTRSVPDMQGIDQSKLVPLLTAALQEAITKIELLTARIAALEE